MGIVLAVWLLVALLAEPSSGSPTDVYSRHQEEALDQPLQEEARKISGGSSKLSIQTISRETLSRYPNLFSPTKVDGKERKPPRVVVLQNGEPGEGVNRKGGEDKIYINNKPVSVEYVNKNTLPQDHPLRKVADKRKEDDSNFTKLFQGLFEIVEDVLSIISQFDTHSDVAEKSDNGDMTSTGQLNRWSMTKKVFLKYLRLLKTSDVFAEFREIIPVTELEAALEKGDQVNLAQIVVKSITPGLFSYVFGLLKELVCPLLYFGNNLGSAELREYIPSGIDLLWPVRFFAHQTLGWIGNYFSRRELVNYWEQFRSLNPFSAPSLDYIYQEEEGDTSMNSLMTSDISRQDGKSILETAMGHPYLLLAGVGSTVMASVYAYKAMRTGYTGGNRIKRSDEEETQTYPWDRMTFSDLYKILSAVESNAYVDTFDDDLETPAVKPKKTSYKKYSSSEVMKKDE